MQAKYTRRASKTNGAAPYVPQKSAASRSTRASAKSVLMIAKATSSRPAWRRACQRATGSG